MNSYLSAFLLHELSASKFDDIYDLFNNDAKTVGGIWQQ